MDHARAVVATGDDDNDGDDGDDDAGACDKPPHWPPARGIRPKMDLVITDTFSAMALRDVQGGRRRATRGQALLKFVACEELCCFSDFLCL